MQPPIIHEAGAARYKTIHQALRQAILEGRLQPGVVLLEGPLGDMFGTSRIPVRQALKLLYADGLIRRFEGRGYLVGRGLAPKFGRFQVETRLRKRVQHGLFLLTQGTV